MENFTLDGEKYTIIDGVMFDAEGEIVGLAERCRPTTVPPDIALEYIRNAGKPAKKKRGPKGPRYTRTLSQILTEDGATPERAAQIIKAARKWAEKKGTPGLACTLLILQNAGELKDHDPGELWKAAELEGIAPDNTARNFTPVFQGGASSISDGTRKEIKKDLAK